MGEMADFALDQMMDIDEMQQRGDLPDYMLEDDGLSLHPVFSVKSLSRAPDKKPDDKTCRCCKTSGLRWATYKNKWRLFAGDKLHICPVNPLNDD